MPATQRGQLDKLPSGRWRLRWYVNEGARRSKSFPSRSAAARHYREQIEPTLRGEAPALPDLTLRDFVPLTLSVTAPASGRRRSTRCAGGLGSPSKRSATCRSAIWST